MIGILVEWYFLVVFTAMKISSTGTGVIVLALVKLNVIAKAKNLSIMCIF